MSNIQIKSISGHMGLDSWILANIIQLATFNFCTKFLNEKNDPKGRLFDQMTQAARSGQANIAEGSSRHQTSVETELKLLDVARASLSELAGDFMFILMARNEVAWAIDDPRAIAVRQLNLDTPNYGANFLSDAMSHILVQKEKFNPWVESDDVNVAANSLLILCIRVMAMLRSQIKKRYDKFRLEGGFTENMTKARLETRQEQTPVAPLCPECGAKMIKRVIQKGVKSGTEFWGCSNYPRCTGARDL